MSPKLLTDHLRVKHGEHRVQLFKNRPASQEPKVGDPVPGSHTTVPIAVPQTSGHWALGLGFQIPDPILRSPDTDQDQEMDSPPSSQQSEGVMVVDGEPVSVFHITVPNVVPQTSGHWGPDLEPDPSPSSQPGNGGMEVDPATQPMDQGTPEPVSVPHITVPNVVPQTTQHMDQGTPDSQPRNHETTAPVPEPSTSQGVPDLLTGSLSDRIAPEVPPPRDPKSEDGWAQIDRVGGWRAIISPFGAMD